MGLTTLCIDGRGQWTPPTPQRPKDTGSKRIVWNYLGTKKYVILAVTMNYYLIVV